ncbi:flagellar motor protein MotB, partial [Actinomyces oris]
MGHHLGIQISPLVRRDETTTVLALKLTRAKDDAAVKEVSDSLNDHGSNVFEAARPLARQGGNRTYEPAAGGVRLLNLSTGRVWLATTGVENKVKDNHNNKLSLKPGESTSCFVLFGAVDAKQVTVFVPQAGFVTVNVLDSGAAAASGIDFKAVDKAFDDVISYSRDESKPDQALEAPVPIERYTRALDDSTSTHTDSKDITVTLASDVTFASDSADLTPAADAQL